MMIGIYIVLGIYVVGVLLFIGLGKALGDHKPSWSVILTWPWFLIRGVARKFKDFFIVLIITYYIMFFADYIAARRSFDVGKCQQFYGQISKNAVLTLGFAGVGNACLDMYGVKVLDGY